MKIIVIASGSKGNVTYIEHNNTKLLIDIGININNIEKKLSEINVDPQEINAILLTHNHKDHTQGLKSFCKKYKTKVYMTKNMIPDLNETDNFIYNEKEDNLIKELKVQIIRTSHDVEESVGFIIKSDEKEIVYITDTGYINYKNLEKIRDKELYIIESNHDVELLMNSKYPHYLKQRILSDKGHLSNNDCSRYLSKIIGKRTKYIILAHLSEENNREQIALNCLINTLEKNNKKIDNIFIAKQDIILEKIEI
jgi:phosphoribosyl 1,2-cyclic phosphodiesterase